MAGMLSEWFFFIPFFAFFCHAFFTKLFPPRVTSSHLISPPLPFQYFEYTTQKEIRFNTVTELCAEVLEGRTSIGMKHCPADDNSRPPSILWEFRQVQAEWNCNNTCNTLAISKTKRLELFVLLINNNLTPTGRDHLPPSHRHVHHRLSHIDGPRGHPGVALQPERQKPAMEVRVTRQAQKEVTTAGDLKWP